MGDGNDSLADVTPAYEVHRLEDPLLRVAQLLSRRAIARAGSVR